MNEDTIRLFVGFDIPFHATKQIEQFRQDKIQLNYSRPIASSNFHITLCFIGIQAVTELKEIKYQLTQIRAKAIELYTKELNHFKKPKVLYLSVDSYATNVLTDLANQIRAKLIGFLPQTSLQAFKPHISLFRNYIRDREPDLTNNKLPPLTWLAEEIFLYQSHRVDDQLTYTKLMAISLGD
ncbi:RNA 2',3'-cyclic phosphodiesterase [Catenovulum sp. SM1970]|uniref:RNA 2',3'-cyclic phosphodiesterase n=1 Tax=Marinifaba aquimaris TaxID=2741323 RepID=UPI00157259E7|nr:RNA 2',3'-cyclic phosphodiesterase [Marinifaba aquimaris]NTS78380.1 RNA 2',3'-cyclic phosphodiesterase [Marinifaba aquimaris]